MAWEQFHKNNDTSGSRYCGVRVSKKTLVLSKEFRVKMGAEQMETLGVWFDKEKKALAFVPNAPEGRSMRNHVGSLLISLWRVMPEGRYIYSHEEEGRYVCILAAKETL